MKKRNKKNTKQKNSNNQLNETLSIAVRYLSLLALMFSLPLIYKIFTPLTIISTSSLLGIFYSVSTVGDIISINGSTLVQIVPACIAGSAYLLLLILNLSVPIPLKKRLYSIALGFLIFFLVNVLRIVVLSSWYHHNLGLFDFTHTLSWYLGSTILILGVWFLSVRIFKIKSIPIYTDIDLIIKKSKK